MPLENRTTSPRRQFPDLAFPGLEGPDQKLDMLEPRVKSGAPEAFPKIRRHLEIQIHESFIHGLAVALPMACATN